MIEIDTPTVPMTSTQALARIWQLMYPDDKNTPDPTTVYSQLVGFIEHKDRELEELTTDANEVVGLREENARLAAEVAKKRAKKAAKPS